jgi:hypothetical protein
VLASAQAGLIATHSCPHGTCVGAFSCWYMEIFSVLENSTSAYA